jgi:hypothetical protein
MFEVRGEAHENSTLGRRTNWVISTVPSGTWRLTAAAKQFAEKLRLLCPAPKGASEFKELTASLKRCPDTKLEFFSKL